MSKEETIFPRLELAVFDIDGTLRQARDPWIHLHEHLGLESLAHHHKDQFFSGSITYQQWVDLDAALWKGFHRDQIVAAMNTNPLRLGAAELLQWFTQRNIPIIGISTGLDIFNDALAHEFGFAQMLSNRLLFDEHEVCSGQAIVNVREDSKGEILSRILNEMQINPRHVVAFGDGSADIHMFEIAGLSVAINPSRDTIRHAAARCLGDESLLTAIGFLTDHFLIPEGR